MLTDAEMQRLLDAHEKHAGVRIGYRADPANSEVMAYLLALDAALPKMVEEIRKLRVEWTEDHVAWLESHTDDPVPELKTDAEKLAYYERGRT